MKFTLEITVTKVDGPSVDSDEVCDALIDEIEGMDLWTDETNFQVEARRK